MDLATPSNPSNPVHTNIVLGFNAEIEIVRQYGWTYTSTAPRTNEDKQPDKEQVVLANTILPTHEDLEERWLATGKGTPVTAKCISKRQHAEGIHARRAAELKQLVIGQRMFPELDCNISSNSMEEPNAPDECTKRKAAQLGQHWLDANETQRLLDFLQKARRYEHGSPGHRMFLHLGTPGSELRISPSEYDVRARELIGYGWTLIKGHIGIDILDQTTTEDISWGFNAASLRDRAREISCRQAPPRRPTVWL